MKKENKKGFTLVELIIVIAVIGVLAAILIPVFSDMIEKANRKSALADAKNAVEIYITEMSTGDGASVVGENSVLTVKKAKKDWYFKYSCGAVTDADDTTETALRAMTGTVSVPTDATVVISAEDSEYKDVAAAYTTSENTITLANFLKNVIMYNTERITVPVTGDGMDEDTECESVTFTDVTYLTFESEEQFSIVFENGSHWDGNLYFSTDTVNWYETEKSNDRIVQGPSKKIYLCGKGNTALSDGDTPDCFTTINFSFPNSTADVICSGNVMSLLDCEIVPETIEKDYCFAGLFSGNGFLSSAPALPAQSLSCGCYYLMFSGCTHLSDMPVMPETYTVEDRCFESMFANCSAMIFSTTAQNDYTKLVTLSDDVTSGCYYTSMLDNCPMNYDTAQLNYGDTIYCKKIETVADVVNISPGFGAFDGISDDGIYYDVGIGGFDINTTLFFTCQPEGEWAYDLFTVELTDSVSQDKAGSYSCTVGDYYVSLVTHDGLLNSVTLAFKTDTENVFVYMYACPV